MEKSWVRSYRFSCKIRLIRHGIKDKSVYLTEQGIEVAKNIALRMSIAPENLNESPAEKIFVNGKEVNIEYKNVKTPTYSMDDSTYKLTIPSSFSEHQKMHVLEAFKKRIERKPKKKFVEVYREFKNGEVLDFGDKKYTIKIDFADKKSSSAKLVKEIIHLLISSNLSDDAKKEHIYELVRKIVSKERVHILKHKMEELNKKHFNLKFSDVKWSKQTSKWGSCSEDGNINISYKLLFAPQDVLEYVCIHELSHIIELNHSEDFWKLVENAMPTYREKIEWLKLNGSGLDC